MASESPVIVKRAHQIVTDGDGKTHLSRLDIETHEVPLSMAPTGLWLANLVEGGVSVVNFPVGFERDYHNSEAVTWTFLIAGECEVQAFDDESPVVFKPGDIVYYDDVTGGGHRTLPVKQDVWFIAAGLAVE